MATDVHTVGLSQDAFFVQRRDEFTEFDITKYLLESENAVVEDVDE